MRVAMYLRVSTDKQNLDSQESEVEEYCRRRGWLEGKKFTDHESGGKFNRAGLEKMLEAIRKGKVDVVVCYKLDRLGRSLVHLAQLVQEFELHKVALVCTSQAIDTSNDNPAGRLQMHVLMAVAEFEKSIIRERTMAGIRVEMSRPPKKGKKPHGRPKGPSEKNLAKYEAARKAVAAAPGMTVRELAKAAGLSVGMAFRIRREELGKAADSGILSA